MTVKTLIAATAAAGLLGAGVAVAADNGLSHGPHAGRPAMQMRHAGAGSAAGGMHGRHGQMRGQGTGRMGQMGDPAAGLSSLPAGTLSDAEQQTLVHMREEEKLAHDVYVKLAATSGLPQFTRIATSETRHADAVKALLDRYGIADPAAGRPAGSFADADLQRLYDQLVKDGSASPAAALKAGVRIETLDIADLRRAITESDQQDLDTVYGHLLQASQHHLAAFSR